eukprot:scaffold322576_cov32-Prasinocladus_malaysianus.AAC.1
MANPSVTTLTVYEGGDWVSASVCSLCTDLEVPGGPLKEVGLLQLAVEVHKHLHLQAALAAQLLLVGQAEQATDLPKDR